MNPRVPPIPNLQQIKDELCRRHLADYVQSTVSFPLHDWQRFSLCPILEQLKTGKGLRLLIHKPPQFGGSIIISKRLPAWLMGQDPLRRIILAGYNITHTTTQFAEPIRNLMQGEDYLRTFPNSGIPRICSAEAFSTLERKRLNDGQASLTSLGLLSGFVGKGLAEGDVLIIDDPYASTEDAMSKTINEATWRFWKDGVAERVDPLANVVVMFHRYHDDDFAARLNATGQFQYIRYPAIGDANEDGSDPTGREPGELLSPMRSRVWLESFRDDNPQGFAGRFQGNPRPEGGGLFKKEYFQIYDEAPPLRTWVRSIDPASSAKEENDATAGGLIGVGANGDIWIKDMFRWKREWPDSLHGIKNELTDEVDEPGIVDIAIQDKKDCDALGDPWGVDGAGYALVFAKRGLGLPMLQDLYNDKRLQKAEVAIFSNDEKQGDKKQRASVWAARAKAGKLKLVKGPWNEAFIEECLAFRGDGLTKDDQVDAVSGGVEHLFRSEGENLEKEERPQPGSIAYYRALREENGF